MVVLIDNNVIIDYLTERNGFYKYAKIVMESCMLKKIKGYVAFHSISTAWYILRGLTDVQRRNKLKNLCSIVQVTGASHEEVVHALERSDFKDFEDCLQDRCAAEVKADYIITRNIKDFKTAETKAITPEDFCNNIVPQMLMS